MPKFTTEDLLLYLYDEMSTEHKKELQATLQADWALEQKYQVLKEAYEKLKSIKLSSPRSKTVASIMQYAGESIQLPK
jgi:penicillin V acylase-like amidase (Ntn superfamily)